MSLLSMAHYHGLLDASPAIEVITMAHYRGLLDASPAIEIVQVSLTQHTLLIVGKGFWLL